MNVGTEPKYVEKNALKALKDKGFVEYYGSKKDGGYKVK